MPGLGTTPFSHRGNDVRTEGENRVRSAEQARAVLAILLVSAAALYFFGGNVADPDLWAHLQYGRTIWQGQGLPAVETYSYSAPGALFYDHEWLTDVVFAGLFDGFGPAGLVFGKLLVLLLMLLLVLDTVRLDREVFAPEQRTFETLTAAVVCVLAIAVIGPGATFRAQLFTMVFLAFEGWLLARADRIRVHADATGTPLPILPAREILAIPPLLLLWANLHGGFLVGIGMFGLYCAATISADLLAWAGSDSTVRSRVGRRLLALAAVGLLALAAPLANPFGWELYGYLARTLDMHDQISEWHPVDLFSTDFLRFKIVVALFASSLVVLWPRSPRGRSVVAALAWRTAFGVVAAVLAFRHQRHTVLFAIVAVPLVVLAVERMRRALVERWPYLRPRPPVLAAISIGAAALAFLQIGIWARHYVDHGVAIRYGRLDYPVDAIGFLEKHGFQGNVAMPFEWGAYAITRMAPSSRVFIDGRFEAVYPKAVIDDYFAFMNGSEGWERLLDAYPTDIVVVQRWRDIHPRLFARDDLLYVYSDPASLVFVREGPRTRAALARMAAVQDRTDFPRLATYFP